jgi:hypothetical protein
MKWIKHFKNNWFISVSIVMGTIALFLMLTGTWGFKIGLVIMGLLLILKGISTKEKNKEDLASATPLGDSPLGCVIGLIVSLLIAVFLRFMPIWFVRLLWFLLGMGLILLSLKLN